jgi:hypothetical protein
MPGSWPVLRAGGRICVVQVAGFGFDEFLKLSLKSYPPWQLALYWPLLRFLCRHLPNKCREKANNVQGSSECDLILTEALRV